MLKEMLMNNCTKLCCFVETRRTFFFGSNLAVSTSQKRGKKYQTFQIAFFFLQLLKNMTNTFFNKIKHPYFSSLNEKANTEMKQFL